LLLCGEVMAALGKVREEKEEKEERGPLEKKISKK
jgi:hypothetical protein